MATPTIFHAATHEEALRRAQAEGRFAIVFVTSASSEMGEMMDRNAWQDARAAAWIAEKAIAVRVDVGEDELLARRLGVKAPPAVIAFKDGAEKARHEGFLDAHHLRVWLTGLEGGLPARHSLARSKGGDLDHDMHGRLSYARALLRDGRHAEAVEHYVWLWENMERVEPAMSGVRVSFMAGDMEKLVAADAAARARLSALRDAAGATSATMEGRGRRDWVVLNKILGEEDRTLAWFDGAKADPGAAATVRGVAQFLVELLKAKGRWADLGRLYEHPLEQLAFHHRVSSVRHMPSMPGLPPSAHDELRDVMAHQFRDAAATLYAALRAAGRTADAKELHEEALRLDPSDEMKAALDASPVRYD